MLPGMVVNPLFVTRPSNHRVRLITDATDSGLNAGINVEDVPAKYDGIRELIEVIRHRLARGEKGIPWKIDVASAFRLIVMHPLYQIRQAMAVSHKQPDGSRRTLYHVDFRGNFGGRGTPFLWTSIMGAVLWIAQKHFGIEFPLAYMDDAHGYDSSGKKDSIIREGVTKVVPLELAAMARCFDALGMPWPLRKAEAEYLLPIVGILIDTIRNTASLTEESINLFAAEVKAFLSSPGRKAPLRKWNTITGWGSWAVTVRPFSRPLLTPLYAKQRNAEGGRKTETHAPVFLNKEVRESLRQLVADLLTGEPLSFLDPILTRWTDDDADFVICTDACTDNEDGTGAGLGYWYDDNVNRAHCFASRPGVRWSSIQFAEAITIVSAIDQVIAWHPGTRRILVKTDSAPCVYAFDGGGAADTPFSPMRTLVLRTYTRIRRAKVDLRVVHVRGVHNKMADMLSRLPLEDLQRQLDGYLQLFQPPLAFLEGVAL